MIKGKLIVESCNISDASPEAVYSIRIPENEFLKKANTYEKDCILIKVDAFEKNKRK